MEAYLTAALRETTDRISARLTWKATQAHAVEAVVGRLKPPMVTMLQRQFASISLQPGAQRAWLLDLLREVTQFAAAVRLTVTDGLREVRPVVDLICAPSGQVRTLADMQQRVQASKSSSAPEAQLPPAPQQLSPAGNSEYDVFAATPLGRTLLQDDEAESALSSESMRDESNGQERNGDVAMETREHKILYGSALHSAARVQKARARCRARHGQCRGTATLDNPTLFRRTRTRCMHHHHTYR